MASAFDTGMNNGSATPVEIERESLSGLLKCVQDYQGLLDLFFEGLALEVGQEVHC